MTTKQIQRRNEKSQDLKVLRVMEIISWKALKGWSSTKFVLLGKQISMPAPAGTMPEESKETRNFSANISWQFFPA